MCREVESLLRSEPRVDCFIEEAVLELAAKMLAQKERHSLLGQSVGSYQTLSLFRQWLDLVPVLWFRDRLQADFKR